MISAVETAPVETAPHEPAFHETAPADTGAAGTRAVETVDSPVDRLPADPDTDHGADPHADPETLPEAAEHGAGRTGYEHLTPLFAEHAALPPHHRRRAGLRSTLICGHLPVARHIARRYRHRGENPDDLEQVATVGLILAVDRFEPERGIDFLSFAVPTITGEVLRHFRDRATMIRVPRRLRALQSSIVDAAAELGQRHGRAARPSEIARHLDVDVEDVLEGLAAHHAGHTSSLDEPAWGDDGDSGDRTRHSAALATVEPEFDLVEYREALSPLLTALPDRERKILMLRFFGGKTQTEIANEVGVSQMHVSRLLSRTLTGLRRRLGAD